MKNRISKPDDSIEMHNCQVDSHEGLEVMLFEELRKLLHFCCFCLYNYYIILGDAALIIKYIFSPGHYWWNVEVDPWQGRECFLWRAAGL